MNDYQVDLIAEGSITQIPDSQKVFGALVYLFAEVYGNEEASKLVRAVLKKEEIHMMLSNVMPYGYLPTPQDYLLEKLYQDRDKTKEMILKEQYSNLKARSYIKLEKLRQMITEPFRSADIYPYISVEVRQQLRASIDSIRYDIPELESKLYSIPTTVLSEVEILADGKIKRQPINKFSFYLQIDDSELGEKLLSMLNQAAAKKHSMILGKRASQGMNLFQINKVVKQVQDSQKPQLYLNMGMLLPDQIDFKDSTIKLFTSERRPFVMPGGWERSFDKKFISFIAEGSMIAVENGVVNAGKSLVSPFNKGRDVVFGNAYLYPLVTSGRAV